MSEIISDIVLSASALVVGWLLSYVVLAAIELVRSSVKKLIGRVKDYLTKRKRVLKAPNGKKSNLTAQQWLAVRTQAFKAWFWGNGSESNGRTTWPSRQIGRNTKSVGYSMR